MPTDRPVLQCLDELLDETNSQIDAILGGQKDPKQAIALAKEIKERAREFFGRCCARYYRLLPEDRGG